MHNGIDRGLLCTWLPCVYETGLGEELYGEQSVINRYAVTVKLTMRFAAAMALNDIELESAPLGLGKVLLRVLK